MCCKASTLLFFLGAILIRALFIYIAKVVDESEAPQKFTDTDYEVFSDAATHVMNGASPFARHTYRYTPLAAYICLVNNLIHPLAGKVVFCIFDILMGIVYWKLIESQRNALPADEKAKCLPVMVWVAMWVYNPLTIILSTRGSNDNIISLMVFLALYLVLKR